MILADRMTLSSSARSAPFESLVPPVFTTGMFKGVEVWVLGDSRLIGNWPVDQLKPCIFENKLPSIKNDSSPIGLVIAGRPPLVAGTHKSPAAIFQPLNRESN